MYNNSSSSTNEIDLHRLLIYGFTREIEMESYDDYIYYIPDSIVYIIISYYPTKYLVYAIGEDRTGCFGLGCNKQLNIFEKLPSWTYFCDSPNFIYHGMGRFILKTKFNKIYCSGRNEFGELGLGLKNDKIMIFKEMKTNFLNKKSLSKSNKKQSKSNKKRDKKNKNSKKQNNYNHFDDIKDNIKIISNGKEAYHTYLITKKGKFYAFGANSYGQFGNGKKSNLNIISPKLMFNKTKHIFNWNNTTKNHVNIIQIECGESHTIFLSDKGKIYSSGNNMFGQCGIKMIDNDNDNDNDDENDKKHPKYKQHCILTPTLIPCLDDIEIMNVKCGSFHNLCLTTNNKIYVFGMNESGQCGMWHRTYIYVPEQQNYLFQYEINKIQCGANHSLCISDNNGYCYLFGDNELGQIGVDHNKYKVVTKPKLFQSIKIEQHSEKQSVVNNINHENSDSPQSIDSNQSNDENKINNMNINISESIEDTPTSSDIYTPSLSYSFSSDKSNKKRSNRIFKNIRIHSGSLSDLHTILLTYNNDIITFGSNHSHQCSHLKQDGLIQQPSILDKTQIGIDDHLQIDSVIAAGSATFLICISTQNEL